MSSRSPPGEGAAVASCRSLHPNAPGLQGSGAWTSIFAPPRCRSPVPAEAGLPGHAPAGVASPERHLH